MELPESQKHFCILPWVHARVNSDGSVYPCCRMENFYPYGSLKKMNFEQIWNDDPIRKMRQTLMKDAAFPACRDCYQQEGLGGTSLRQHANNEYQKYFDLVKKTSEMGLVPTNELVFLDLRFSNVCNFRCRTCNPENSTSWYIDAKSFQSHIPRGIQRPTDSPDQMWAFIDEQLPSLKKIYFAGGEPMLQDEHYELLEQLIERKRTDIELTYNTNLSRLNHRHWKVLELWQSFPKVSIAASLDGVEKQGEFLRKGMTWKDTLENFRAIRAETPHVHFSIFPTVGLMNAFHLTRALEVFIENKMITESRDLELNILLQPTYLSIRLFGSEKREMLENHYQIFLQKIRPIVSVEFHLHLIKEIGRLLLHMKSANSSPDLLEKFRKFTIRLDHLRNERTVIVFPELFDFIFDKDSGKTGIEELDC